MPATNTEFYRIVSAAVRETSETGYVSDERLDYWAMRIRQAAEHYLIPASELTLHVHGVLRAAYDRLVERETILQRHALVERYTLPRVKPALREELDRRIVASADLIKLNRERAIETTLGRFRSWSTSIPPGGSRAVELRETTTGIRRALTRLPFEDRRVAIDQGHKLVSNLSQILAVDGGAIGGFWRSHYRDASYNARPDHKLRDGRFYVIRGNWALQEGLVRVGPDGYTDEITRPGEEINCRCWMRWVHGLRRLPPDLLTEKGRAALLR